MKNKMDNMSGRRTVKTKIKVKTKLSTKRIIAAAAFIVLLTSGIVVFINLSNNREARAGSSSGDYRSLTSGNWSNASTWEKYNGTTWAAAGSAPTSADGIITIQNGHTVTVTANVSVDQVVINTGGEVDINSGITLTVANGAGTDLDVTGIVKSTGTLSTGGASVIFQSGGKYQHNQNGSTLPSFTWNTGSTCEVTGVTTTLPSGLSQTFKNFTWNCSGQSSAFDLNASLQSINGDLTIISTGSSSFQFDQQGNNNTLTIGGNFNFQGGTVYSCTNGSTTINLTGNYVQTGGTFAFTKAGGTAYGNTSTVMNVTGNVTISGGTLDLSQCDANNSAKGIGQVYLKGNMTLSGTGLITETSAQSSGQIYFNSTTVTQYFTSSSSGCITQQVDFTVNSGAILRMDDQIITGAGNFSLLSGGGLMIGDGNGITSSAASGNIQCTGTRSYSTGGDYTYNGIIAQNSGDGLPSSVHNLTFNNNNNITLTNSTSVSNILTFTTGLCITSANTLTLGTSTATLGTLSRTTGHVVGNFKRWIAAATTSNILFPVGTLSYYNGANVSFTVAPTAGSITSAFVATNPGTNGFSLTDAGTTLTTIGYGYWSFTAANSFAGGTYTVNLYANGFPGITDYTDLHIVRRVNGASAWTLNGTHGVGTGSNSAPVVNRTGMTSLGHFGIGSGSTNPLPIELVYFNAKLNDENTVDLSWSTASEINNDYFTIERSADASHFAEVMKKQGAGNSTHTLYYSAVDPNPLSGYSYYRLKQTDYDGHSTYSGIKSVNNAMTGKYESELKLIAVSPNPFTEKFKVAFTMKKAGAVTLELVNSSGKIVATEIMQAFEGPNTYNFIEGQKLSQGIYFINLICNDKKISQKIIKD